MAAIADLVIKKADTVTNITYNAVQPSSGDGVPAIWRNDSGGTAHAFKPLFRLWTRDNGPKTARRVEFDFTYPQLATDSTTTLVSVVNRAPIKGSFLLPTTMPAASTDEAVAQCLNCLVAVIASIKAGYAPT